MFTNLRCCHFWPTIRWPPSFPTSTSTSAGASATRAHLHTVSLFEIYPGFFFWKLGDLSEIRRSRKHGRCRIHSISFLSAYHCVLSRRSSSCVSLLFFFFFFLFFSFSTISLLQENGPFKKKPLFRPPTLNLFNHTCRILMDPLTVDICLNGTQ